MKIDNLLFSIRAYVARLLPCRCVGCGRTADSSERYSAFAKITALSGDYPAPLCSDCREKWERERWTPCKSCGFSHFRCKCLPGSLANVPLFVCHIQPYPHYGKSVTKDMVLRLKQHNIFPAFLFIADQLTPIIENAIDKSLASGNKLPIVTNVPRGKTRTDKYGVDPAAEIAKLCAKALGYEYYAVLKAENRSEQKNLRYAQRFENVKGAYHIKNNRVKAKIYGRDIIIIDDVITTGATVSSCAAELLRCGALSVSVAAVAKTDRV